MIFVDNLQYLSHTETTHKTLEITHIGWIMSVKLHMWGQIKTEKTTRSGSRYPDITDIKSRKERWLIESGNVWNFKRRGDNRRIRKSRRHLLQPSLYAYEILLVFHAL